MSECYQHFVRALEEKGCREGRQFLCPAHDDHRPSLSVAEGDDGRVLLKCHAGCVPEDIVAALGLSMSDLFDEHGGRPTTMPLVTYPYEDENGTLKYESCRFEPKRFCMRRPDGNGGRICDLRGVQLILYKLPDLLSRQDETVYIVEGEKDVDRLHGLGLLATTNPLGAGRWRDAFSEVLRSRVVVVIPDNDEAGRKHAEQVARSLVGVAVSIKILELPDLQEKGDVSDWLTTHSKVELMRLAAAAAEYETSQSEMEADEEDAAVGEQTKTSAGGNQSLANILIPIVLAQGIELFHDQRGDTFAAIPLERGQRITSLRSKAFAEWLGHLAWKDLGRAVGTEQRASVQNVLSGKARYEGRQYDLHVRCAAHEGAFWLDLDGVRAVRVVPGEWEIVNDTPILFRPFHHQRAIPDPVHGGDPRHVWAFVNLRDQDSKTLLLCYLVAALVPDIPIAALVIHGVQGSAKTTFQKIVKLLLDPSAVAIRGGVRGQDDFAIAASQNRVLFFDNLSSMPGWLSDALCRTVTGEGWSKRTLYTDDDSTVLEYRGVVGLSGINLVVDRADLLDRSLIMELEPVSPAQRMEERELWDDFETARPQIVGGLLDALARAMQVAPGIRLRARPRMADFARWGTAAAIGLRLSPGDFLDAYERNVGRQNEAALGASPVAQALMLFMKTQDHWMGTPAQLHGELDAVAGDPSVDTKSKRWPKSANWLSRRLKEVQPNLLAVGIQVEVGDARTAGTREITVTALSSQAPNTVIEQQAISLGVSGP
jgi:5S rRNA maturation endonuclease (ribonuclease M5)